MHFLRVESVRYSSCVVCANVASNLINSLWFLHGQSVFVRAVEMFLHPAVSVCTISKIGLSSRDSFFRGILYSYVYEVPPKASVIVHLQFIAPPPKEWGDKASTQISGKFLLHYPGQQFAFRLRSFRLVGLFYRMFNRFSGSLYRVVSVFINTSKADLYCSVRQVAVFVL